MRLVIDLIRGRKVNEALHICISRQACVEGGGKVLRSAVANLQNKEDGGRLDPEDMVVKTVTVDGGMMMKRISPAPMGRAFRIRKRSNHVTIVVEAVAGAKTAGAGRAARTRGQGGRTPAKPLPRALAGAGTKPEQKYSRRNFGTENASGRASPRHSSVLGTRTGMMRSPLP